MIDKILSAIKSLSEPNKDQIKEYEQKLQAKDKQIEQLKEDLKHSRKAVDYLQTLLDLKNGNNNL